CPLSVLSTSRSTRFPYTTLFRSLLRGSDLLHPLCSTSLGLGPLADTVGPLPSKYPAGGTCLPYQRCALRLALLARCDYQNLYLRSEEHTSELQSRFDLVCRLLLD